jgi:hypothetical protein
MPLSRRSKEPRGRILEIKTIGASDRNRLDKTLVDIQIVDHAHPDERNLNPLNEEKGPI